MDTCLPQFFEKTDKPWISILETTSIDKFYLLVDAIVVNALIVQSLSDACPLALTIVHNNLIINISTTMTIISKTIVAQAHIMPILSKSLHLIVNFLGDSTDL
jgi:predicted short-subunit dehydrogenase-like oxidoreductase (DUF2520 family)